MTQPFSRGVLALDAKAETERIAARLREVVLGDLRRKGLVVGMSGGIDSSVVAALAALALGKERVLGLLMPESESSPQSLELGTTLAEQLGIATAREDITAVLEALGCYRRRDEAIRKVVPDYGPGWASKIVLPDLLQSDAYRIFQVVVRSPDGHESRTRLSPEAYHGIVAASNFKQRARKMLEYHHADRLQYAVAGTPNLLEYDQGFFVKCGDGAADVKPIAHLYKTQVYMLAEHLRVPEAIRSRPPTTDTYPLAQSQEEFYFSLPYEQMDLALWAFAHGVPPDEAGAVLGLDTAQVERVYRDIEGKRRVARYLHAAAVLMPAPPQATE